MRLPARGEVWRAALLAPGREPDDRPMRYRDRLPQLDGQLFLTDGGIETVLIFHEGLDLPAFAAFDLLKDDAGTEALRRYYAPYASLAASRGLGFGFLFVELVVFVAILFLGWLYVVRKGVLEWQTEG